MKNLLFICFLFLTIACSNNSATQQAGADYINVNNEKFTELMAKSNTVILDVRTPAETEQGIIPGAVLVDYQSPDFEKQIESLDKSKEYLVYCHKGGRSAASCEIMKQKGFKILYNLEGGYSGWAK